LRLRFIAAEPQVLLSPKANSCGIGGKPGPGAVQTYKSLRAQAALHGEEAGEPGRIAQEIV